MIQQLACPLCNSKALKKCMEVRDYTATGEVFPIIHCNDCSLRFTGVIPEIENLGRYYQATAYVSHTETKEGLVNKLYHAVRRVTLKTKRKLVQQHTHLQKGKLLDVGCGTGAFAGFMQSSGWEVVALEPDDKARQLAIENHQLKALPAHALYSLSETFDAITLWHVLEHVHDVHGYMKQLNLLLKPGGVLLIAVPNYTSFDAVKYGEHWAAWDVPRHLYHFSPASIKRLADMHAFEVKEMLPMWFDSFYVSMLSEKYKGSSMGFMQGTFTGLRSNLKAMGHAERCSSVIYVLKKKAR